MSPNQFEVLEEAAKKSNEIKSFQETGANTGVITTKDVTVDFTYDPLRQILNYNIGAKHSLAAKIAGDNMIANHITALIHNFEYLPKPEPVGPVVIEQENKKEDQPVQEESKPVSEVQTTLPPGIVVKKPIPQQQ